MFLYCHSSDQMYSMSHFLLPNYYDYLFWFCLTYDCLYLIKEIINAYHAQRLVIVVYEHAVFISLQHKLVPSWHDYKGDYIN